MNLLKASICIILLLGVKQGNAQLYFGNFLGEDSKELNGLLHVEIPIGFPIPVKSWGDKLSFYVAPSYVFGNTRLNNGWIFSSDGNGNTSYMIDPDPNHTYNSSIFSYQTRIRTWTWEMKMGFTSRIGKTDLEVAYAPRYIQTGSFRRKFTQNNENIRTKDRFSEKADFYNIRRFQHRVYATVAFYGIGLQAYTNLSSFFKKSTDIDLQRVGVTLAFKFENMGIGLGGKDGKNGKSREKETEMKQM